MLNDLEWSNHSYFLQFSFSIIVWVVVVVHSLVVVIGVVVVIIVGHSRNLTLKFGQNWVNDKGRFQKRKKS